MYMYIERGGREGERERGREREREKKKNKWDSFGAQFRHSGSQFRDAGLSVSVGEVGSFSLILAGLGLKLTCPDPPKLSRTMFRNSAPKLSTETNLENPETHNFRKPRTQL